jgi:phenylalanyl-tRNA synthetase beta chain
MKLPFSLLREWVSVPWDAHELARRLTFAGFEIEAVEPAAPPFRGVIVARIISAEPHPRADSLQVCRVTAGAGTAAPLQIVCGAANARAGLVTALATIGAELPGAVHIKAAVLRGVESQGMLCSARELGLAESSDGILELPPDSPLGVDLRTALDLDDPILEVNVTPNRGDALSILGIAREVAVLSGITLGAPALSPASEAGQERESARTLPAIAPLAVSLQPGAGAGRLLTRIVRGLDNTRSSPPWLRERLRRCGLRSISPVVDATNYLMLELGQPMHAYDYNVLRGTLAARRAVNGERLELLDGREIELTEDVLVIADDASALGLAGIMGGQRSAITAATREVALEVAWFVPAVIAGRARRYGLQTDASQRFERGVDWQVQERALEHVTSLILQIAGGQAGPITGAQLPEQLPASMTVTLRARQLERLLGAPVAAATVEQRLSALGMKLRAVPKKPGAAEAGAEWHVEPPSWRFDINIEADLIEEVARIGGFDLIGEQDAALPVKPKPTGSAQVDERAVLRTLAARGYQEAVSFAFVDPELQRQLFGAQPVIELANPIASELAVMRTSLWPGLLRAARENLHRQQQRVRLFEIANRYLLDESGGHLEQKMLAALALGTRSPEQWATPSVPVDFYDLKGDLEALLTLGGQPGQFVCEPAVLQCLHPGRSARILRGGTQIGHIGELHPRLASALDFTYAPILLEIDYAAAFGTKLAQFEEVSRFPHIRRDISFTVPEVIAFRLIRERVTVAAASLLKELRVFDVYQGTGVESGRKSVALGLILQDLNRTLTNEDADRVVEAVRAELRSNLDARIRE